MIIREFKGEIFVVGNSYITRAREKRSSTNQISMSNETN